MKRIIKNPIFTFILGIILTSSITVVAYTTLAKDIGYTPKDNTWEVDNVKDAIDQLYTKANDKIILNTFYDAIYGEHIGTLSTTEYRSSINLEKGKYIILSSYIASNGSASQNRLYDRDIFCSSNNCSIKQLSGKNIQTSKLNTYQNIYFLEVKDINDIIYVKDHNGVNDSSHSVVLSLQAIPFN